MIFYWSPFYWLEHNIFLTGKIRYMPFDSISLDLRDNIWDSINLNSIENKVEYII